MKRLLTLFLLGVSTLAAQTNTGELRLRVTDPSGLGVKTTVKVTSEANQYHNSLATDEQGNAVAQRLPYGVYRIEVEQPGFAAASESIEIHSSIPLDRTIQLKLPSVKESVTVVSANTLIDPDQAGAVNQIGSQFIQNRLGSLPGRSLQDLVNSQPGWLYEGNAVLHPRESEYQTQFVVDGIPLTDNRSPSFGPEIEADDVESMSVYTAGIPAEYGRKLGGVIEVNTLQDSQPGFHGELIVSGGSYDTAGAFARGQYVWGKNTLGASASGDMTGHYLNPVVPQNFTNTGTTGDFAVSYQRDLTSHDRLGLSVRHELSRFQIPNEFVQQAAGQRQYGNNFETMGIVSYEHVFSSDAVADVRAMVRDDSNGLRSNSNSTPVIASLNNWFREGYVKGNLSIHRGIHEWKFGLDSDNTFLNENFSYQITNTAPFDPGTPLTFAFPPPNQPSLGHRPDLEQSAFVQDMIRVGNWAISAGLRWDHYQLLVNRNAVSPRVSAAHYFPSAGLVLHASYDRVFQTPSSANILLSSSPTVVALNPNVLRLPVLPSHGDYYEAGLTKSLFGKMKLDADYFRRLVNNFADDDQLLNTGVSFPIAFHNAVIYGAEAKLDLSSWRRLSGFVSYSYMVGNAWLPLTGGLFLGDDATNALNDITGHFPVSQDQRNTVRGRTRYEITPRFWIAGGVQFDSGLPFEFVCPDEDTLDECVAGVTNQYGTKVVSRINFARGRIYPTFQLSVSGGANVYKSDRMSVELQVDGENLTNVLDVIDFGGLFSGNAIGPGRNVLFRLTTSF
ncbi:MAG TPA: TonB-dependent receptor [Candidatus Acidoferrales bacterium]|nr:TonB-dependent receptor [Candidatus Acidoferrales bacterium]